MPQRRIIEKIGFSIPNQTPIPKIVRTRKIVSIFFKSFVPYFKDSKAINMLIIQTVRVTYDPIPPPLLF